MKILSINPLFSKNYSNYRRQNRCENLRLKQPLKADTVQFKGINRDEDSIILNKIRHIQSDKVNVNGNHNVTRDDCIKLLKFFGFVEQPRTSTSHIKFSSPYISYTLSDHGNNGKADPGCVADIYRAIKNADKTNGELLVTCSAAEFQLAAPEFIKRTNVNINENNRYRALTNPQKEAAEEKIETPDDDKKADIDYTNIIITRNKKASILKDIEAAMSLINDISYKSSVAPEGIIEPEMKEKLKRLHFELVGLKNALKVEGIDLDNLTNQVDTLYEEVFDTYDVLTQKLSQFEPEVSKESDLLVEIAAEPEKTEPTAKREVPEEFKSLLFKKTNFEYDYSFLRRKYSDILMQSAREIDPSLYIIPAVAFISILENSSEKNESELLQMDVLNNYLKAKGLDEKKASKEYKILNRPLKGKVLEDVKTELVKYAPKMTPEEVETLNETLQNQTRVMLLLFNKEKDKDGNPYVTESDKIKLMSSIWSKVDSKCGSFFEPLTAMFYSPYNFWENELLKNIDAFNASVDEKIQRASLDKIVRFYTDDNCKVTISSGQSNRQFRIFRTLEHKFSKTKQ